MNASAIKYSFESGVWEQCGDEHGFVPWGRHRTEAAARKAAIRIAKELRASGPSTGGALSWAGGYRSVGQKPTWLNNHGENCE
jgi:hypothetical protein